MNTATRFDSIQASAKDAGAKPLGRWGQHFLRLALDSNVRFDDDQAFLHSRSLEQVWVRELEQPRPEYPLASGNELLPLGPKVDDGATSYTYRLRNRHGKARWGSGRTRNGFPTSSVSGAEMEGKVRLIEGAYEFSNEDTRNARFTGRPIEPALRDASLEAQIALQDAGCAWGVESIGIIGLFNHPNISVITAADNGSGSTFFRDKNIDQITADFAALINAVPQITRTTRHATKVLMSPRCMRYLRQTRITTSGDSFSQTILGHLVKVFSTGDGAEVPAPRFPVEFAEVLYLDATDERSQGELASDSLFAYIHNNPDVVSKVEAFKARAEAPERQGLMTVTAVESKVGGVEVSEPATLIRMDGVFNG